MLYLIFNEGYSGDVDLAAEAIRSMRQLAAKINHEEAAACSPLCCSTTHGARHGPARRQVVPLAEQDRGLWNTFA